MTTYNKGPLNIDQIFGPPTGQQTNNMSNFGEKVSQGYSGFRSSLNNVLEAKVMMDIGKGVWGGMRRYGPTMLQRGIQMVEL